MSFHIPGIVHENPRILSDGESEEISGTSSEDYVSPVKLRNRPRRANDVSSVDWSSNKSVQKDYLQQILAKNFYLKKLCTGIFDINCWIIDTVDYLLPINARKLGKKLWDEPCQILKIFSDSCKL